jgi:RNA polymerase sigma-70 factor (ECF subfamily)
MKAAPNPVWMPMPPSRPGVDVSPAGVYRTQVGYVWNSLRRLGVAESDREDLCHEVFIAFFRGQANYDPERPLRPWLFGIAFRVASDHRRRAWFRREVPREQDEVRFDGPDADDAVAQKEARRMVERALDALDIDQRAVFILHEIDELPMPEIATVLEAPLNTLYSRLRLGRRKFEAEVQRLAVRPASAEPQARRVNGGAR